MISHFPDFREGPTAPKYRRRSRGSGGARQAVQNQSFHGTFTNKLDAKGRVSIPAGFRQVLAAQGTEGVFCIPALGLSCAKGFGERFHAESREVLKPHHPLFDQNHANLAAAVFPLSQHLSFDDAGRVRLPDEAIAHAGIKERVFFAGYDSVFEIWNPEIYEPVRQARMQQALAQYQASGKALP
jgi:MraZ protein